MQTRRKLAALLGAIGLVLTLAVGPAWATEAGSESGQTTEQTGETGAATGGEDNGKIELPLDTSKPRDAVGLGLVAVVVIGLLLALDNARRQLKGERPQASGKWRYR